MRLLEFVDFLKKNPRLPVKVIAMKTGVHPRNVQKFLRQIEVAELRGNDPLNGRKNVILYQIQLPKEKAKALV